MADAFTSEMRNNSNFYLQLDSDDPDRYARGDSTIRARRSVYGELGMAHSAYFLSFENWGILVLQFFGAME